MANIFGAILAGFKKKKDEEDMVQPVPAKPTPLPQAEPINPIGKIGNAISTSWNNFWQPSAEGVRIRDFIRELPGASLQVGKNVGNFALDVGRGAVTRPAAQAVLSVSDLSGLRANLGKGEKLDTIVVPENDMLGRALFGDKPLESYQKQTKSIENFLDTKTPLPKQAVAPVGIMAGIVNAGLDLPGGGIVKSGGKEGAEQVLKEVGKENADEVIEQIVKNSDELAPLLKELPVAARGTLDDALAALKERGVSVAENVLEKLKGGKVIEGEGYVLQSRPDALIANFDTKLKAALPEVATEQVAKQEVPQAISSVPEVLQDANKGVDDATKILTPSEATLAKSKRPSLDQALKQTDEAIPAGSSSQTAGAGNAASQTTEDYLASRPTFESLDEAQKGELSTLLKESGFESKLAEVKGAPVTQEEVIREALKAQDTLSNPITREQTVSKLAEFTNTNNVALDKLKASFDAAKAGDTIGAEALAGEFFDNFVKSRSVLTDAGRTLNLGGNMIADSAQPAGVKMLGQMFRKLGDAADSQVEAIKAAWQTVDKTNPEALREFYFSFVQPTTKDIADEYKYINLLSSPLTQARNIMGNLAAVTEEPVTQVARGLIDRLMTMTGRQANRTTYAREAVDQVTGMFEAIPKAWQDAKAVFTRAAQGDNLDLSRIPVGKYAGQADIFSKPGRFEGARKAAGKVTGVFLEKGGKVNDAMQAGDRFFKSIIEAGTKKAKVKTAQRLGVDLTDNVMKDISETATKRGLDLTLQTPLAPGSHTTGYLNQAIDVVADGLMKGRNVPGIVGAVTQTMFPFIGIAANAMKRVVSYLPGIGALNAIGADSPAMREIAARQLTGTVALMGSLWATGRLAQEDRIAGAAPQDPEGKANFLAAHPEYSVKLGNTWVQTSRMGTFGKLVETAIRYQEGRYHENNLTDSQLTDLTQALLTTAVDMSDESYLSSLGDLIDSVKNIGSEQGNYAGGKVASTPIRQNVPLVGFQGWLSKLIDPVNRKSTDSDGGVVSNLMASVNKNLPFLSLNYDPYMNPDGTVSTASRWNSLSPYKLQQGNDLFETIWSTDRFGRQTDSAQRKFSEGTLDLQGMMDSITQAAAYFSKTPKAEIDLGEQGKTRLPNKNEKELLLAPKAGGISLNALGGSAIRGSQPIKGVSLKGKTKVSAAPKVKGGKTARIKLPNASKQAGSGIGGVNLSLPKLSTLKVPKKKSQALSDAEARERSKKRTQTA
jgi:hypothetical protein